jgi:hypothetical protein
LPTLYKQNWATQFSLKYYHSNIVNSHDNMKNDYNAVLGIIPVIFWECLLFTMIKQNGSGNLIFMGFLFMYSLNPTTITL